MLKRNMLSFAHRMTIDLIELTVNDILAFRILKDLNAISQYDLILVPAL